MRPFASRVTPAAATRPMMAALMLSIFREIIQKPAAMKVPPCKKCHQL